MSSISNCIHQTSATSSLERVTLGKKTYQHPKVDEPEIKEKRQAWNKILTKMLIGYIYCLVFMDEMHAHTHMTRRYGRGRRGVRAHYKMRHRSTRYTIISAIGLDGMKAKWAISRGMTEQDWVNWVSDKLSKSVEPERIVIWVNLDSHYNEHALSLLRAKGVVVLFQSRDSSDYNPIEKVWSKLKQLVRGRQPRSAKQLRAAIDYAWDQITEKGIEGFFKHCGLSAELSSCQDQQEGGSLITQLRIVG